MNKKTKNIVILILNIIIIIFEIFSFYRMLFKGGDGNMQVLGFKETFKYFTNLSNCLAGICSIIAVIYTIKNLVQEFNGYPHWFFVLKFVATIMMSVTFITCVVFLGPLVGSIYYSKGKAFIDGYLFLFDGVTLYLHCICPLLAMILIFFFEDTIDFKKKEVTYGLIPVVLYSVLYSVMVLVIGKENGGWEDFYGFTFGGSYLMALVSCVVMFLGTYVVSFLEWKIIDKRIGCDR